MSKNVKQNKNYSKKDQALPKGDDCRVTDSKRPRGLAGGYKNDVSWYKHYPHLVEAQSSIIFNKIMGSKYNAFPQFTSSKPQNDTAPALGGIMIGTMIPLTGATGSDGDPINVAAKNAYTFIRHANSGSANYESSDLYQYWICASDLQMWAEHLKMVLRTVLTYKADNKYLGKELLAALGYTSADINSMISNHATLVGALNVYIAQLNSLKVPKDMDIYKRRAWLVSHLWADAELSKASIYGFKPKLMAHYDWANSKITYTDYGASATNTFAVQLAALASEITTLLSYEDIGIMIGDTLKAYGDSNCVFIDPIGMGDTQYPVYEPEVLNQFRNITVCGTINPNNLTIQQVSSNSQLLVQHYETSPGSWYQDGHIYGVNQGADWTNVTHGTEVLPVLAIDKDQPTSDDVILATRLTCVLDYDLSYAGNSVSHEIKAFGTEVISDLIVRYIYGSLFNQYINRPVYPSGLVQNGLAATITQELAILRSFDYYPQLTYILISSSTNQWVTSIDGVNNIVITPEWLTNLHNGCAMSLYSMPMFKLLEAGK